MNGRNLSWIYEHTSEEDNEVFASWVGRGEKPALEERGPKPACTSSLPRSTMNLKEPNFRDEPAEDHHFFLEPRQNWRWGRGEGNQGSAYFSFLPKEGGDLCFRLRLGFFFLKLKKTPLPALSRCQEASTDKQQARLPYE